MLTESYGGICPVCGYKRMMLRYGSSGWLHYDACPKCGFAFASNGYAQDPPLVGKDFWNAFFKAEGKAMKAMGFPLTLKGVHAWMETLPEPKGEPVSVFDWTEQGFFEEVKEQIKNQGKEKVKVILI
jgi:ssDNA-binding Zn-finger/Zn-ribbon topoisomerase 1